MLGTLATPATAANLPKGFVHLRAVDATIRQDMRYATTNNFTGAVVPGYGAAECVLAAPVAGALSKVQADLAKAGFGLVVFDCYRPARAVSAFVAWAKGPDRRDPTYFPAVPRSRLIPEGYIGARSGHSTGGSIDLGLVDGKTGATIDMGTPFDFFDRRSHTLAGGVSQTVRANRQRLVTAMERNGFSNYRREWWHFRYRAEPFAGRAFDFEIPPFSP